MRRTPHAARFAPALALALCLCPAPGAAARAPRLVHAPEVPRVVQAPEAAPAPSPPKGFPKARPARADAAPAASAFEFESGDFSYRVGANGNGRRARVGKGGRARHFNLRLDGRYFIEGLRYAIHEGDVLLVCELNDGEAGAGLVARLEQPSMRALWRQEIPAFNVGEPLRDGHALYVTGIGLVGRLDLRTGQYDWLHDGLYDERAGAAGKSFNSFEAPELAGETVLFRDKPVYNPRRKAIVVVRKTGKIIRIE